MDLYAFSLLLGGAGLGTMAVAGLASGAHGHGSAHGHGHDLHGHDVHAHDAHAHDAHGREIHAHSTPRDASRLVWTVLSPRVAFSALVGFGAAGMLLRPVLGGVALVAAAVAGGIAFERLVVAPLWRFFSRFESGPALTLETSVTDEARAVTSFDAAGQGLVAVELDGQIVQLLGTLSPDERSAGLRVRAGDRVRIEAVDAARNRCTVTYLGA
jgi:translation initiation factor IF-1